MNINVNFSNSGSPFAKYSVVIRFFFRDASGNDTFKDFDVADVVGPDQEAVKVVATDLPFQAYMHWTENRGAPSGRAVVFYLNNAPLPDGSNLLVQTVTNDLNGVSYEEVLSYINPQ